MFKKETLDNLKYKAKMAFLNAALVVLPLIPVSIATLHVAPILTDVDGTTQALENYPDLEIIDVGGGVWFGGSSGDMWRTKFEAFNTRTGKKVTGYGTSGILKGTTLRFDTLPPTQTPK